MEDNFSMRELRVESELSTVVIAYVLGSMLLEVEIMAFLSKLILLSEKKCQSKIRSQQTNGFLCLRSMKLAKKVRATVEASTDNAKISRKRSKPDKHGHGKGKRIQEPGECYQRLKGQDSRERVKELTPRSFSWQL
ncbi:hypothetical protein Tco_0636820 [Tanacetum coccineum]